MVKILDIVTHFTFKELLDDVQSNKCELWLDGGFVFVFRMYILLTQRRTNLYL